MSKYECRERESRFGDKVESGVTTDIKVGNCAELGNIPEGTMVHNVELKPGKGAELARSAGASAQILGREDKYVLIRLSSGETRKVLGKVKGILKMDVTVKKKINPVRVIIAAVIVCACLAVLFYIRANTVEDIVASLVEKGSMDNMIWFVKYFLELFSNFFKKFMRWGFRTPSGSLHRHPCGYDFAQSRSPHKLVRFIHHG